jgi:LmbE family N-acetylglucosaminyl deacetylase
MNAEGAGRVSTWVTGRPSGPAWQGAPEVSVDQLVPDGQRLLVVAPHPADEILGCGALLYLARRAGREVCVLLATDASARFIETCAALGELGLGPQSLAGLELPDGGSLHRWQAEVSRAVVRTLRPNDVVVMPWREDGHADHEVVAHAVLDALQVLPVPYLEVPIAGLRSARSDGEMLPWSRAVRLPVEAVARARKEAAARCLTNAAGCAVDRLECDDEVFFH